MKQTILLIIITLFLTSNAEKQLVFLSELSRHGARSPMYNNLNQSNYWSPPMSHLTQIGERQHFLLGQQFKDIYITQHKLLPETYDSQSIQVVSSSRARTQMSALSQLYGLYFQKGEQIPSHIKYQEDTCLPPFPLNNGKQDWQSIGEENLPNSYQPISIFSSYLENNDPLFYPGESCPEIEVLEQQNQQSETSQQFYQYLVQNGVIDRFRTFFNIPSTQTITIKLIADYFDTLYCNKFEQLPLPKGMTKKDYEWINFVYNFSNLYQKFGTKTNLKLNATKFLKDLLQTMEQSIHKDSGLKFKYYSASDTNINLLNLAFGVVNYATTFEEWESNEILYGNAPFASTLLFEVYQDGTEYFVKYIYNGKPQIICDNQKDDFCSWNDWVALVDKWSYPDNQYSVICGQNQNEKN